MAEQLSSSPQEPEENKSKNQSKDEEDDRDIPDNITLGYN